MVDKVIGDIRSVEDNAVERVRQARGTCEKIIRDARREAARLIDKEVIVAENKAAQFLSSARKEGEETSSSIKTEAEKEKEKILLGARERFEEALQYISDKIIHGYQ